MLKFSLFKKREMRRFDYQPVFYDQKKDKGDDTIEIKKFDFKSAREEQKAEISPGFDMYHRGSVDYDTERIRRGRITKMVLMMAMAFIVFVYYIFPRPKAIGMIEEAFDMPPLLYEAGLFLIVFVLLILFIREQNKV